MNNNYKTNTYGNKIKLIACIVAAVLAFALVAGLVFGLTKDKNAEIGIAGSKGGAQLSVVNAKGISLLITPIDLDEQDEEENEEDGEYEIDPDAESAYYLTATVMPETVTNRLINWTIAFNNSAAEWATDKTVTDYVKLTPISDDTAVLECMGAFGEQIKVTAASDKDETKTAECIVDYKQKLASVSATLDQVTYSPLDEGLSYKDGRRIMQARIFPDSENVNNAEYEVSYEMSEVYTIKNDYVPKYHFTFTVNEEFISKLNDAGYKTTSMPEVSFGFESQTSDTVNNFFDKSWISSLLGGNVTAERINALIDFLDECSDEPVFTLTAYEYDGGDEVYSYDGWLDVTVLMEQYQVENVQMGDSNIVF